MFKGQPKGLYALALANTGERFGYYTMLAIFTLFLQAKFGFDENVTGKIYGGFLAMVYFLPLLGGFIADRWWGYGKTVTAGIFVMFVGYLLFAIPTGTDAAAKAVMFTALFLIALGTGLFKGNLQVMVGNLYDDPRYSEKRDSAFSLFYMAINIGAMFAPSAATKITNVMMAKSSLVYNAAVPSLSHQFLDGNISAEGTARLETLAQGMGWTGSLQDFASTYIEKLSAAYNYGFAVACVSLIVSYLIYVCFRSTFRHTEANTKQQTASGTAAAQEELTPEQTKQRVVALLLVFAVVIFFWMSFHQNGLTLTYFARDYTTSSASGATALGFDVFNLAVLAAVVYTLFGAFQSETARGRFTCAALSAVGICYIVWKYFNTAMPVSIEPQLFQQFNPFYVVALTPFSMAIFGALARKGKEPSAPRKIGIGMILAACGFLIMTLASLGLASPAEIKAAGTGVSETLVSQNWLISTYLVLTFAELFLSPMGISFVSKVAPPKLKGAMMGCWFAATAIGNYLTSIIAKLWGADMPLWGVWSVLIVVCLVSAAFIFSIMKKLENATK